MKFTKETLNILKNFSTINSSIFLSKGNFIMTRAINGTVYAEAKIPDTIDADVAIYDLNTFLSVLSLVGESADINLDTDENIEIKNERSSIFLNAADPSTISYPKKAITFPVANIIFDIKGEDLQQLLRVSRSMQIDTLGITTEDGKIVVKGYNKAADSSNMKVLYSLVTGDYDGTNNFEFFINMANIKMQPADYKCMIAVDPARKQAAIKFEATHAAYIVAFEADSRHDF